MGDTERLLSAARSKLNELQRRVQEYTSTSAADPVRIAVYQYTFAGGAEVVAAIEAELRAIAEEQEEDAAGSSQPQPVS